MQSPMLNKSLPSHPDDGGGYIHRSVSESVAYPPASPTKSGPFSQFLRRKKASVENALPPPIPPKDTPPLAPQDQPSNVPLHSSELPYYSYHSPKNSTEFNQGHSYTQG